MKVEDAEYRGGLSSCKWRDIIFNVEGYRHESRGCGVSWRVIIM